MAFFGMLSGYRTYLAASGLIGLALHHFASGLMGQGLQSLLTALAVAALRRAIGQIVS